MAFASVAGALTSHQRALSPTVRSTLVNSAAVVALLQPGDGRATISAAAAGASVVGDSVVEDSVVDVSPPDSLSVVVAVDEFAWWVLCGCGGNAENLYALAVAPRCRWA